jgi:hypothetical protein
VNIAGAAIAELEVLADLVDAGDLAGSAKNQGDPFVVALAMCGKLTVVSGEGNGSEIHPTIPFACGQMVCVSG